MLLFEVSFSTSNCLNVPHHVWLRSITSRGTSCHRGYVVCFLALVELAHLVGAELVLKFDVGVRLIISH